MESRYIIDGYLNWRRTMEARYGRMVYGGSNGGYMAANAGVRVGITVGNDSNGTVSRLRYEGPICLDRPGEGESWTVTDMTSPYYKFTNERATLRGMGFTDAEMDAAKGVNSHV